jgi:hypothetical protein
LWRMSSKPSGAPKANALRRALSAPAAAAENDTKDGDPTLRSSSAQPTDSYGWSTKRPAHSSSTDRRLTR